MLFRNCLIGSAVFHLALLVGVSLWRTNAASIKPAVSYLQIYREPVATGQNLTNVAQVPAGSQRPESATNDPSGVSQTLPPPSQIAVKQAPEQSHIDQTVQPAVSTVVSVTVKEVTPVKESRAVVTNQELSGADPAAVTANSAPTHGGVPSLPVNNRDPAGGALEGLDAAGRTGTGSGHSLTRKTPADLPVADTRPVRINAPVWDYPAQARYNNWEGTTVLRLVVRSDGRVGEVTVITSSGHALLDREAVRTVKKWRYRPATREGRPVDCQVNLPFVFKLEE